MQLDILYVSFVALGTLASRDRSQVMLASDKDTNATVALKRIKMDNDARDGVRYASSCFVRLVLLPNPAPLVVRPHEAPLLIFLPKTP